MHHLTARVSLALLAVLTCSSCETISSAPKGSPRVELEVVVNLDATYSTKLTGSNPELLRAIADLAMTKADLGLRFYPVLSSQYGPKDPRPEYLLTVDVRDLDITFDHSTTQVEGGEPIIKIFIKQVDCAVSATLSKRRATGPALVVGRSEGKGSTVVASSNTESKTSYPVNRQGADKQPLVLLHTDLVLTTEKGLLQALSGLLSPVDREMSLRGAPHEAQPATPK
jgi:hypothetical protein